MATFAITKSATVYRNGSLTLSSASVRSIADGDDSNYQFVAGESITINFANGTSQTGTFKGTTTAIGGGPYAVVEYTSSSNATITLVLGTGFIVSPPNTVSALNIDTANPLDAPCFFSGTLIATPFGERKVEDLVPGDPILIGETDPVSASWIGSVMQRFRRMRGCGRSLPVKWIGRKTISTRFGPAERLMPVRFSAGSLGGGGGGGGGNQLCRIAI